MFPPPQCTTKKRHPSAPSVAQSIIAALLSSGAIQRNGMNTNHSFFSLLPSSGARAIYVCACLLGCGLSTPSMAGGKYDIDRPGGADHPLLSRYQGSIIHAYGEETLGVAQLGAEDKGKVMLRQVEGRISNRLYWGPAGSSALEVFRNYQQALKAAGFQTIYACDTPKCLTDKVQDLISKTPETAAWKGDPYYAKDTFNSGRQPRFHYLSAQRAGASGTTYVSVALADSEPTYAWSGRVRQFIQIIEPDQVELGKVTVDAKNIQGGLKRDGRIALYGVTFDTNKAVLSKLSDVQLGEMASALKAAPDLKVFIVGHTDNQGELQANTALSQQRADAVVSALAGRYGISQSRLTARGVANLAPVASNDTEQGRAQNRRVELVVR